MVAAPEGQAEFLADAGVDGDGHGQVHGAASAEAAHRVGPHRRPRPVSALSHARDAVVLHIVIEVGGHCARVVLLARGLHRADVHACIGKRLNLSTGIYGMGLLGSTIGLHPIITLLWKCDRVPGLAQQSALQHA